MLDIWNHYNGRRGEFRSFELPAEVVSYGSITDYVPGTYIWRYAGPGSVEDLPCGGHNVSLTLETVPPAAASVVGAQLFLQLRLSTGGADGGEYVLGINETVTLSLASLNAMGANQTITFSLAAGAADDGTGIDPSDLGAILWYDFADSSSVTVSSGRATGVIDKGSLGRDLSEGGGGPLYGQGINQLNCIDFGSANHSRSLANNNTGSMQIAEIYAVIDASFGSTFPDYNGLFTGMTANIYAIGSPGSTGLYTGDFSALYVNGSNSNTYSSALPSINSPCIVLLKQTGGSAVTTTNGFQIGQDRNIRPRGWYGLIGEVAVFSSALSQSDRKDLLDYLSAKWNIALDP
jgi:hypothetical protein